MTNEQERFNNSSFPYFHDIDLRPMDPKLFLGWGGEPLPKKTLENAARAMLSKQVDDDLKKAAGKWAQYKDLALMELAQELATDGNVVWLRPTLALIPKDEMSITDKIGLLGDAYDQLAQAFQPNKAYVAYNQLARYCWNIARALADY